MLEWHQGRYDPRDWHRVSYFAGCQPPDMICARYRLEWIHERLTLDSEDVSIAQAQPSLLVFSRATSVIDSRRQERNDLTAWSTGLICSGVTSEAVIKPIDAVFSRGFATALCGNASGSTSQESESLSQLHSRRSCVLHGVSGWTRNISLSWIGNKKELRSKDNFVHLSW